jgi:predicted kinase
MAEMIFITGGPASGKSTIAQAVARRLDKRVHIRVDQLREMVIAGLAMPTGTWTADATQQFRLARTAAIQMARTYADAGFAAIIDDVCIPEHFAQDYAALPAQETVRRILLKPTQQALLDRLAKRNAPFDQFLAGFAPWVYACMDAIPQAGWIVLDSSNWTIEETIEQVVRASFA